MSREQLEQRGDQARRPGTSRRRGRCRARRTCPGTPAGPARRPRRRRRSGRSTVVHTPMIMLLTSARAKWLPRLGGERGPEVVQRDVRGPRGGVEGVVGVAESGDDHPVERARGPRRRSARRRGTVRTSASRRTVRRRRLVTAGRAPPVCDCGGHVSSLSLLLLGRRSTLTPRNFMKTNATSEDEQERDRGQGRRRC